MYKIYYVRSRKEERVSREELLNLFPEIDIDILNCFKVVEINIVDNKENVIISLEDT